MTLLKIAELGHPVLFGMALPVESVTSTCVQTLISDMTETMTDSGGVGLAAPQVYRSLRLFVAKRMDLGEEAGKAEPFVLCNPKLEWVGEERVSGIEGCLSIPGMRAIVPRYEKLRYEGWNASGEPIEGYAQGHFARVIQHEYDHLEGILYPARLADWRHMASMSQLEELERHLQAGSPVPS